MQVHLRQARPEDASAIMEIKQRLQLSRLAPQRGGFLLGTDLQGYQSFIQHDWVMVAEDLDAKHLLGFMVVLGQERLMQSEVWSKAQKAKFLVPLETVLARGRVAYIEQLAMLPDVASRVYAKDLAFRGVRWALQHHSTVFTTVVAQPVANPAVLPFLRVSGFERVGEILEEYPQVGAIQSEIYALSDMDFKTRLQQPAFQIFLQKTAAFDIPTP